MTLIHTPRPWYVYEREGYSWAVIGPPQTMPDSSFKHKANAYLIAAAPDMLAALEAVCETGAAMDINVVERVWAAIAKAKGEERNDTE